MATYAAPKRRYSIWQSLTEAIRGTDHDFTEGSISKAVFLLATPMVLEMLMESLFAIVDVFWVTRLGSDAVATVGLTESMLTIVFSVALGVSMSTTAMVARRVGEKDQRSAETAGVQAILLGVGVALAMGLPGYLLAPRLLEWMGASQSMVASGRRYTAVAFAGCISIVLLFINNAIFRGAGDASIAMRVLWFANLLNLALDPCLIFGLGPFPAMGVTGAAVATLTGRTCGVLYQFWLFARGSSRIRVLRTDLRVVPGVIWSLVRVSSTGVLQFLVAHSSWIVLVRFISSFGSVAVAGYTIGIRIFVFAILPSWGMSGAAATMVGQNLGARKPDRAARAVYLTGFYNMAFLALVATAFIFAPGLFAGLFTSDSSELRYAVDCLRIIAYGNLAYAFGMVLVQAFNGAGDTVTPTLINVAGFWLCEIPLAWALAFRHGMGADGVFAAIPISEAFITAMSLAVFLHGRWKRQTI
jgi:putative MATE family efflux protein